MKLMPLTVGRVRRVVCGRRKRIHRAEDNKKAGAVARSGLCCYFTRRRGSVLTVRLSQT